MDELVAWFRAQLDDDRRAARAITEQAWRHGSFVEHDGDSRARVAMLEIGNRTWLGDYGLDDLRPAEVEHIARWDPARALAEVDAKRRILELHAPVPTGPTWEPGPPQCSHCAGQCHSGSGVNCDSPDAPYPCPTVRLLALPYAARPGYQESWRP